VSPHNAIMMNIENNEHKEHFKSNVTNVNESMRAKIGVKNDID